MTLRHAEFVSRPRAYLLAARPKTLLASASPVLLGIFLAASDGHPILPWGAVTLACALLLQIGANLANDFWDAKKGADTDGRLGPPRVTSTGLLRPGEVLAATAAVFLLASVLGAALLWHSGWPIFWVGAASIFAAIFYTAGPAPLAYLGLGDVLAFVFFGPIATAGTFFILAGEWSARTLLAGCIPGAWSVALIAINNLRDRHTDRKSGKFTLAARFGSRFARSEILGVLLIPAGAILLLDGIFPVTRIVLAAFFLLLALPVALPVVRGLDGRNLNRLLGRTALGGLIASLATGAALL